MMILKPLKLPPMIIESNTAFDAPDGAFTAGDAAASHRRRRHSFLSYMYLKWSTRRRRQGGCLGFRKKIHERNEKKSDTKTPH